MANKIAVHIGARGETAAINSPGKVVVYCKRMGIWGVERITAFSLAQEKGLREMRKQMAEMVNELGDCKIFVAGAISGVPYYELEKAGLSIWEFDGKPEAFLEHILAKEEAADAEAQTAVSFILPIPEYMGRGCYRISIKEIQERETGFTTKQVLLPFLRKIEFSQLDILCNHVPPWMEAEAMTGGLILSTEKIASGEIRATLHKAICGE